MKKYLSLEYIYLPLLFIVPIGFGLLSLKLGQDINWDLLNYHIYNPYALLNGRIGYDLAPAGIQTHYNPLIDILYFKALTWFDARLVGFLLGFFQGLNYIILYYICHKIISQLRLGNYYSIVLALAGVLSVVFLSELGTTFHDSLTAIFLLSSLLIIISSIPRITQNNININSLILMFIAGLISGLGAGIKLVILIFAFALFLSFFTLSTSWKNRFKLATIFGFGVTLGWLISGGFWAYLMWFHFGNPLFPHYNNIFESDLTILEPIKDERFLPKSLFEVFFYPIIFTFNPNRISEIEYKQISWLILYLLIIVFFIYRAYLYLTKNDNHNPLNSESRFLIAYMCFGYVLWLKMFGINRYLAALELLVPIVVFIVLISLIKSKAVHLLAVILISLITLYNLRGVADWGRANWRSSAIQVESNELINSNPSAIFLGGQPLAWIIPSINTSAPLIQTVSNLPTTKQYWQLAESQISSRNGDLFIILESDKASFISDANNGLSNLNLEINKNSCKPFNIYLGDKLFDYKYCAVEKTK